jgi:hypothetical protein
MRFFTSKILDYGSPFYDFSKYYESKFFGSYEKSLFYLYFATLFDQFWLSIIIESNDSSYEILCFSFVWGMNS